MREIMLNELENLDIENPDKYSKTETANIIKERMNDLEFLWRILDNYRHELTGLGD